MNRSILVIISAYFIFTFSFSRDALALDQGVQSAAANDAGTSTYVYGLTSGRARSLIGVALGLASLIIGWRAKAKGNTDRRSWSVAALALGLLAIVLGVTHLASNTGGFGTGGGRAGSIVATVLAVPGVVLGGLVLRRRLEQG